ncbi:MAG: gamma carbonic anhydrase family protein [Candidatus Syntropharchaeia archaeon]
MTLYEFEGKIPRIGRDTYVSEHADIIGDVIIGDNCFIGPGARIRGDYGRIIIGSRVSIQENCILHAAPETKLVIGDSVNVGHGAILHHCRVGDRSIIGMGAIVSYGAEIGEECIIGEGCVVERNQKIPSRKIAVGIPARIIGDVEEEKLGWKGKKSYEMYSELAKRYLRGLKKL